MKKRIAIILTVVSLLTCLAFFAGCTQDARQSLKETFCNHKKWEVYRYEPAKCNNSYDVTTYSCTKCQKHKTEKTFVPVEQRVHDWLDAKIERGEDCQHHDYEIKKCNGCGIQTSEELETYGPHVSNNFNGKCRYCGTTMDNN